MQRLMVIVQSESLPIGAARIATEKARLAEAGLLARPAAGELVWEATLGNPEAAQAVQEIVDKLRTIHGFCVQLIQVSSLSLNISVFFFCACSSPSIFVTSFSLKLNN